MASLTVLTTSGASDRKGFALRNWHGWTSGAGMVWLFPVPRASARAAGPLSFGVMAFWPDKGRQGGDGGWRSGGKGGRGRLLSARHTLPAPPHALSHACVCARHTGACNMPWVQQRRCWRRTLRESSRERRVGDGADSSSSEAGRVPEEPQAATDGGARCTARVRDAGGSDTALWDVNLDPNARGPADHEHLGRGRLCPPLSLPQSRPFLSILFEYFDLYLYSEGTQASTLWRVSSWSPSRSCSFRCVSSSPSTLTSTASLESTFDRLPLGRLSVVYDK